MRDSDFFSDSKDFSSLVASDFMEREVAVCTTSTNCREVASRMIKIGCGSLPVVDGGNKLVGIISEFDLLRVLRGGELLKDKTVSEVMIKEVITVNEDTSEKELVAILESTHLIRVPVVNDGNLVGIVSRRDVLFGFIQSTSPHWHL